ncbi:MAG: 2OG-Fe(II) oxygenase [Gammaproteobacteria bacterium]|nr:2OG-Fe(II) oxygenase [Gammaproteobacteria bacterium]
MEFKKGAITVIDDIFTTQDCSDILDYYDNNRHDLVHRTDHRNKKFLSIVDPKTNLPRDGIAKNIAIKLLTWMDFRYRIEWGHIEEREPGSHLPYHYDLHSNSTVFTSVTYLNDDYDGGYTIIRPHGEESDKYNIRVIPKAGRTVFFHGAYNYHCVTEVEKSNRYVIPMWYMFMPLDLPEKLKWWI